MAHPSRCLFQHTLVFLCIAAFTLRAEARSFLDPLFERIDPQELQAEISKLEGSTKALSSEDTLYLMQLRFFLGEAMWFHQKIHERYYAWEPLAQTCEELRETQFGFFVEAAQKAQARYTCALLYISQVRSSHPLLQMGLMIKVDKLMVAVIKEGGAAQQDRHYVEGRVYHLIPRNLGKRVGKSLFNLQLLQRMNTQASSVSFWLGRIYQIQGNERLAKKHFKIALAKKDKRASLFFGKDHYLRNPEHLDGMNFGWSPRLFFAPTVGFGVGLTFFDDRLFDTPRKGLLNVVVTTRENFGASLTLEDRALIKGFRIKTELRGGQYREEYYGLGMSSLKSNDTQIKNQSFLGSLSFIQGFWDYFYLSLGWKFESDKITQSTGGSFATDPLPSRNRSSHTGPIASLGFDNRDSLHATRRGYRVELSGYFPSTSLGSDFGFENWRWVSEAYFWLGLKHILAIKLNAYFLSGTGAPFGMYAKLGQHLDLPAVRAMRFQDRNALGGAVEYRYEMFKSLSLLMFATAGRVASQTSALLESPLGGGGGFGVLFHPSYYHSPSLRLEMGIFSSEFILNANVGVTF